MLYSSRTFLKDSAILRSIRFYKLSKQMKKRFRRQIPFSHLRAAALLLAADEDAPGFSELSTFKSTVESVVAKTAAE